MSESKVDLVDLLIDDYKSSNDVKVLYKYLEFVVSYKQEDEVLKIIRNQDIFNAIIEYVETKYDRKLGILWDLWTCMWQLQNREICGIILRNQSAKYDLDTNLLLDKTHKMFVENWKDVLKLAYYALGDHVLSCHLEPEEFQVEFEKHRRIYEGYVDFR